MPAIRIVIVNYRTAELTLQCLRSLESQVRALPDCRVVVVDNHSEDGSKEILSESITRENWEEWVELIPLTENRGFAAGNNAALRRLLDSPNQPEYVLLLNPDTIALPNAVHSLATFLDHNPHVHIIGSRLENRDGTPQRSAFRFPGIAGEFESGIRLGLITRLLRRFVVAPPVCEEPHATDWVSGASLMVRRSVFESVGLLDEEYFLYFEETDFLRRAIRANCSTWYVPESRVVHLVGQSTGVAGPLAPAKRMPEYWFASRSRYFRKNHGWLYSQAADAAWLLGQCLWRIRVLVERKSDSGPPWLIRDFLRFKLFGSTAATGIRRDGHV